MNLPIQGPIAPMLSKLQRDIPVGEGWLYEPKWDGFRAIVFKDGDEVLLLSRDKKSLNRYFPELEPALARALPDRCVIDGEIIVSIDGKLDFDALQMRIHPAASRVQKLSREIPAGFVAFDALAVGDRDLRNEPFVHRRAELEKALGADVPNVSLTPETADASEAEEWFSGLEDIGLDGVIAKRRDLRYLPGERAMIKVKKVKTADCVVGGYRLSKSGDGVGSLLLGLYDDGGTLQYVGHTSSFKAAERRQLLAELQPLEGGRSFGAGRSPGGPSRWAAGRETTWVPLSPELVCEVSFDKLQGERFRHAATFLRWRTDKSPAECTFDQIAPATG